MYPKWLYRLFEGVLMNGSFTRSRSGVRIPSRPPSFYSCTDYTGCQDTLSAAVSPCASKESGGAAPVEWNLGLASVFGKQMFNFTEKISEIKGLGQEVNMALLQGLPWREIGAYHQSW